MTLNSSTISGMINKLGEKGAFNPLLFSLIIAVILLLISSIFGAWAYSGYQDYKNNADQKIEQAVAVAVERAKTEKDNEYIEKEKEPLKEYRGPADIGSVNFKYPKTWSGYVEVGDGKGEFIFYPDIVSSGRGEVYSLRVSVVNSRYEREILTFDNQVRQGKAKATIFKLEKVPDVEGVRINGELDRGKQGSMIILPLRDKTIKISVESTDFLNDFNKIILPNFSFTP